MPQPHDPLNDLRARIRTARQSQEPPPASSRPARLKEELSEVGGESPGEARRAGAVEWLQAERDAGNEHTR